MESGPPETARTREAPLPIPTRSAPSASASVRVGIGEGGLVAEGGFEPPTKGL